MLIIEPMTKAPADAAFHRHSTAIGHKQPRSVSSSDDPNHLPRMRRTVVAAYATHTHVATMLAMSLHHGIFALSGRILVTLSDHWLCSRHAYRGRSAMDDIRETQLDLLIFAADPQSGRTLIDGIISSGLTIQVATSADFVMSAVARSAPAALLMLPQRLSAAEGIESLLRLRSLHPVPCIIRAGSGDGAQDRVSALEAGADEVLHVGMPVSEAVARIHAILRRARGISLIAGWRLIATGRLLESPYGDTQKMTNAEYTLLSILAAAGGDAVERDAISEQVFRRPWRPDDRAVDSLVKRVRRKLPPDAIQSVRSVGYALTIALETGSTHVEICAPHMVATSLATSATYTGVVPVDATKQPFGKG